MKFQSRRVAMLAPLSASLLALAFTAVVRADGSADAGQAKSTPCVACHGVDGNSSNPQWPNLAGQQAQYIVKQLQGFKGGARKDPLMSPMAAGLSDADMADLAAYFSSQTRKGGETDPAKLALGQRLYRGGDAKVGVPACAACHGPSGDGNPAAVYPAIQGQQATYVEKQLKDYRANARQTDGSNQIMRNIASAMSDEQIAAVASYVQGLR
jgi:cytochrome c553